jgi:hypothetical protein
LKLVLPGGTTRLAVYVTQVFADRSDIDFSAVFAEFMAPIVLETSGVVAPLQYGFPRAWVFGNVHEAPLHELAREWVRTRGNAFRRLCCDVRDSILERPDAGVVNWYVEVHRAAEAHAPCCTTSRPLQVASA